jgi:hypothetical protein
VGGLLQDDHPPAEVGQPERGGQAGGSAADHGHIELHLVRIH